MGYDDVFCTTLVSAMTTTPYWLVVGGFFSSRVSVVENCCVLVFFVSV